MATVLTEGRHAADFIISEAEGKRSRDTIIIASGAGKVLPGTVLGKVTASGKYVPSPDTGADGSQTAAAINIYEVDATSADVSVAAINADAEVNVNELVYHSTVNDATKKGTKQTQLRALGIKSR